jgi:hypothetical protein
LTLDTASSILDPLEAAQLASCRDVILIEGQVDFEALTQEHLEMGGKTARDESEG